MASRKLKKIIISIIGGLILIIGIVMIIVPGPAYLIIPAGLGILGTEYMWAKRLHQKIRDSISLRKDKVEKFLKRK